ncbi:MAG TPA: YCF48-related protein [Chitinophagales bacterium]|nr:YCF48-related protein [Chitinophagales bacterium]
MPSCQKEKITITFTELSSATTDDLHNIFFLDDSTGYVCGGLRYEKGDVLKTTDGGFTWHDQSTSDMDKALYKITFPSRDTGYACGYEGGKVFRTFDGGNHWDKLQSNINQPLRDLCMLNSQKGFCCGGDGFKGGCILNTSDAGNSWQFDTSNLEYRSIFFFNDLVGVIAGYGAIQRTTDGGETWTYTNAEQDFFVSMNFVNDEVGYAVGYTGSIMKTTDGGQSWDRLRNSNSLFQPSLFFNTVIFRDVNVGYIAGEHGCLLKTEDGGDHWKKAENVPDVDWKGIALMQNGGIICGAGGKIFRFLE